MQVTPVPPPACPQGPLGTMFSAVHLSPTVWARSSDSRFCVTRSWIEIHSQVPPELPDRTCPWPGPRGSWTRCGPRRAGQRAPAGGPGRGSFLVVQGTSAAPSTFVLMPPRAGETEVQMIRRRRHDGSAPLPSCSRQVGWVSSLHWCGRPALLARDPGSVWALPLPWLLGLLHTVWPQVILAE